MAAHDLTERVEVLEVKVAALEDLPERVSAVESQIVQLREDGSVPLLWTPVLIIR
jgi:chaperonin cofactor prefoldin